MNETEIRVGAKLMTTQRGLFLNIESCMKSPLDRKEEPVGP